jgi:hypothetical protein
MFSGEKRRGQRSLMWSPQLGTADRWAWDRCTPGGENGGFWAFVGQSAGPLAQPRRATKTNLGAAHAPHATFAANTPGTSSFLPPPQMAPQESKRFGLQICLEHPSVPQPSHNQEHPLHHPKKGHPRRCPARESKPKRPHNPFPTDVAKPPRHVRHVRRCPHGRAMAHHDPSRCCRGRRHM